MGTGTFNVIKKNSSGKINDMPELKPGMVVVVRYDISGKTMPFLYVSDNLLIGVRVWDTVSGGGDIVSIYTTKHSTGLTYALDNLDEHTLLWEKETAEDRRIAELEKTINEAQRQIQELKKSRG